MIDWTKPSGLTITTNDLPEIVAYCESLGWTRGDTEQMCGDDLTADDVSKMRKAGLKKLAKQRGIEIDESLNVTDMRCAIVSALFEG